MYQREIKLKNVKHQQVKIMIAILYSSHQEVARIPVENLNSLGSMAGNPSADDMIKVCAYGEVFWCDEIEFIK